MIVFLKSLTFGVIDNHNCYQNWRYSRETISKREEASAWPLDTMLVMPQNTILGHIEVEKVY
jgi:hypothetical protein